MDRRTFLAGTGAVLLAIPLDAEAQQAAKVPRIGVLSPGSPGPSPLLDAFRQGLRELGYVEGQNILIEYRFAEAALERLPTFAAELVRLKVDVILTINTPASQAAKDATKTIPIVFTWVGDSVGRLVANLARPGGNTTGLTTIAGELGGKRLGLLKEALPGLSRVAILWNSTNPGTRRIVREMEGAGPQLGLQIHSLGVRGPDEFQNAFKVAARERAGALRIRRGSTASTPNTHLGFGGTASAASGLQLSGTRGGRGPYGLWTEPC